MIKMKDVGLTADLAQEAAAYEDLFVARISLQSRELYQAITPSGEIVAEVSGKLRYCVKSLTDYPAVGDFVMLDRADHAGGNAIIHHVLRRKSAFIRKAAGTAGDAQIIAANIDTVFICMALNHDYNLRRLERYLAIAWDSGASPVVVLTKADLCEDIKAKLAETAAVAVGVEVLLTTNLSEDGYQPLQKYLRQGETVAFIGSSGVGKSTLINRLAGNEILDTGEIRSDGRGRHTTTRRQLILLADGGMVIDTPGMRELAIESADLAKAFADIDSLAAKCRFRDCTHESEPGCAVLAAIAAGTLSKERLTAYKKLEKEAGYEGLSAREIETAKITAMFAQFDGKKNARDFIKSNSKRKMR